MLVVSRKNGQKIMINDNIVITIVESRNGQCKIAIDADKDVKIYNYQSDALILVFANINTKACFEKAEEIRRAIATSIFIFNEGNHLQLTVSQCVSETRRSDENALTVISRAETSLQKACKFTRNITVKA